MSAEKDFLYNYNRTKILLAGTQARNIFLHTLEEFGEIAQAISIAEKHAGKTYKKSNETPSQEAIDLILCAITAYMAADGSVEHMHSYFRTKELVTLWTRPHNMPTMKLFGLICKNLSTIADDINLYGDPKMTGPCLSLVEHSFMLYTNLGGIIDDLNPYMVKKLDKWDRNQQSEEDKKEILKTSEAIFNYSTCAHLAEETPRLLCENYMKNRNICMHRMEDLKKAEDNLLALKCSERNTPRVLHDFLLAEADKGCPACWVSSAINGKHADCQEKIKNYFDARLRLIKYGETL